MKRISAMWFAMALVVASASTVSAQQGTYMLVEGINGDQVAPHAREFKVNSVISAATVAMTLSSTGLAAGKATFAPVKVSMPFHGPTNPLFYRSLVTGMKIPAIEVRFYNSMNRMFYKTVYGNALVTGVSTQAADDAAQEVDFVYTTVRWFASPDASGSTAPAQIGCWDIAAARAC